MLVLGRCADGCPAAAPPQAADATQAAASAAAPTRRAPARPRSTGNPPLTSPSPSDPPRATHSLGEFGPIFLPTHLRTGRQGAQGGRLVGSAEAASRARGLIHGGELRARQASP